MGIAAMYVIRDLEQETARLRAEKERLQESLRMSERADFSNQERIAALEADNERLATAIENAIEAINGNDDIAAVAYLKTALKQGGTLAGGAQ